MLYMLFAGGVFVQYIVKSLYQLKQLLKKNNNLDEVVLKVFL